MPIKVRIDPVFISTRPEDRADLNWKESYAKAHARWLAEYTLWIDPERLDENRYHRCPHGCLVAIDTEQGGEANYCTASRPLMVSTPPRLTPYPMKQGHPLRLGLSKFPRNGAELLTLRGTIGRHYYPGDHEICPYNPKQRMRTAETVGGYVRSGSKDGNGIRAVRGNGPTDESLELRWADFYQPGGFINEWRPGSFAADPAPDAGCLWVEAYRFYSSRATRIVGPTYSRPDPDFHHPLPSPIELDFNDERTTLDHPREQITREWDVYWPGPNERWFIRWTKPLWAFHPFNPVARPVLPSWDVLSHWHEYRWAYRFQYPRREPRLPQHFFNVPLLSIDVARREKEERELIAAGVRAWRKKRRPYHRPGRKPWVRGWRTERKMRDLDADLKAYEWGSHNELRNVPQMLATARQNYREARKEWAMHRGRNVRQQSAAHRTTRSLDSLVNHVPAPALVYEPRQTYFLRKPVTFPRLPFQLTFNFWQESTASSAA